MRYPQTFVDDLKRQADIVRVVQDYVQLKKKGANWMACCPFHKEKTPSFSVSPAKEIFYCFGCHKGGSVFNFVMEMERCSFPEAIKLVAEKSGVPLPALVEDSRYEARRNEAEEVIQLNKWALEYWEQQLESSNEGRIARDYLNRREISEETRKTFRLGYAPDSWEALSLHLRQKGATQEQIERSGLVVKKDEGGSYDRFRGRLIFPVMDVQGKPIAFGGRTLRDESAKYINSPETAAYIKGRNLFGLNLTRDEIRRGGFLILVEGFLDLIVPYQFGIKNIAASLGTAFTPEQARLIGRFARKVVVNYDGDNAGVSAAKKALEILLAEDIEVKVLVLPDNSDPDEFIRKSGAAEYQRLRGEAQPHIQFVIDQAVRDRRLSNPADKEAAINDVLPYIRAVHSRIQKREYFDIAMDSLRVTDNVLKRELWHSIRQPGTGVTQSAQAAKAGAKRNVAKPTVAERQLLELILLEPQMRSGILRELERDDYDDLPTAPIFRAIIQGDREQATIDFDYLSQQLADDPVAELLPGLLMAEFEASAEGHSETCLRTAGKCLDALRLMKVDRRIGDLTSEIADAERKGELALRDQLATEHLELSRLRNTLLPRAEALHTSN
jgi:DNA primase